MQLQKDLTIFNFTDVYDSGDLCGQAEHPRCIACGDIPGTNCICDDPARAQIMERIREQGVPVNGIHFIDNGNYHYMSAILTSMVAEPFALVYFDHHPDLKASAFGDILSCGSWVRNVQRENPFVRTILAAGVEETLFMEIPEEDRRNVLRIPDTLRPDEIIEALRRNLPELPVYLSLDKDVLSRDVVQTNWDQGSMSEETLCAAIRFLKKEKKLIGVDICGEISADTDCDFAEASARNMEFNKRILSLIM